MINWVVRSTKLFLLTMLEGFQMILGILFILALLAGVFAICWIFWSTFLFLSCFASVISGLLLWVLHLRLGHCKGGIETW